MPKEKTVRRSGRNTTQASTLSSRPNEPPPPAPRAPPAENLPGPSGVGQEANLPPVVPQVQNPAPTPPVQNPSLVVPATPMTSGLTTDITNLVQRVVQESVKEATREILRQVTEITLGATQPPAQITPVVPPQSFPIQELENLGQQLPFTVQTTSNPTFTAPDGGFTPEIPNSHVKAIQSGNTTQRENAFTWNPPSTALQSL